MWELVVLPCEVNEYLVTEQPASSVTYELKSPGAIDIGRYGFQQQPYCDYEESIEVLGLPSGGFIKHDASSKALTLSPTSSESDLGVHDISIISSFNQLKADGSLEKIRSEIVVRVNVVPCIVQTFAATSEPIKDAFYELDTPGFELGTYAFEQSPDCGYPWTISF